MIFNVAGIPTSAPLQGYQFRLHFDGTKTSIVSLEDDILNGGFLADGGYFVKQWIDENGNPSPTPTNTVEIAYTEYGVSDSTDSGKLASITLTHLGVPGDIELSITDVVLSDRMDI